jgi:hypothetical protein
VETQLSIDQATALVRQSGPCSSMNNNSGHCTNYRPALEKRAGLWVYPELEATDFRGSDVQEGLVTGSAPGMLVSVFRSELLLVLPRNTSPFEMSPHKIPL